MKRIRACLTRLHATRAGLLAGVLAILGLGAANFDQAQSVNSSQLQSIFNSLPADQQQQLLLQLGAGADAAAPTRTQQGDSGTQDRSGLQRRGQGDQLDQSERTANGRPLLKPLDSVLVDIDFLKLKTVVQTPQAPGSPSTDTAAGAGAPTPVPGTSYTTVPAPVLAPDERARQQRLIDLVRSRNPYRLTQDGALQLPGFAPIALAGLSEDLASKRLAAEPSFGLLEVKLTLLPLKRTDSSALAAFGYDLFTGAGANLALQMDVPVPANYVIGPGDELSVQLFGSQNRTVRLTVDRDGKVAFPELGPIEVGGRAFSEVKADIESRISRQMIGVHASLSIGTVRPISVFVVGEVNAPGSYTVTGLSTITSALSVSGGIKPIGSLRDIQLKRGGRTVRHFDLYDLLMHGDTSDDAHLLPGDVIFIPTIGTTVSVMGEVRRPGIYELKGATEINALIDMAGGFTVSADARKGELERVDEQQHRVAMDVDFSARGAGQELRNGDLLRVGRLRPTLDSGVFVQGEVYQPGSFAWREGLKVTDIIGSVSELKPGADPHYLLIRRESPPDRHIAVLSTDLVAALRDPGSAANTTLEPRDQITVFDLESGRERVIKPLMDELKLQSNLSAPAQTVTISGRVKVPGDYPLEVGMKVSDLIRAGGSLDDAAYGGVAELSRYVIENGQARRTQLMSIDLAAALRGDLESNLTLLPYDGLYIKQISGWSEQEQITLGGEIRFPGRYPIKRGETLSSVIERAGGLTDLAFADGSIFTREELRVREQQEIDHLTDRMQNELAATSLMLARVNQSNSAQTYSVGQSLLVQLKATKAVGRLVINLSAAISAAPGSANDVVLKDGDRLLIPKRSQEVTVIGEVQNVTSHLYRPGLSRDGYVHLSGGTTRLADRGRIYVVRADGSVIAGSTRWFKADAVSIHPGDTIVVPLDTEREPALPLWLSVTTILYNIAIAAAALHTF